MDRGSLRDALGYSIVKYVAMALGFLRIFFCAWVLGPEEFGVLGFFLLMLGFLAFAHFGVLYAMSRDFALSGVLMSNSSGEGILSSALVVVVSIGVLLGVSSVVVLALVSTQVGIYWSLALLVAIGDLFRAYFTNYFRLRGSIRSLNVLDLVYQFVSLGVLVSVVAALGVAGALGAQLSGGVACLGYCLIRTRGVSFRVERVALKALLLGGFPLLLYNFGFYSMGSIDRLFIVGYFDDRTLGQYTFSNQVSSGVLLFLSSMLFLYYPQAIRRMHREAVGAENAFKYSLGATRLLEGVGVVLYVAGAVIVEFVVALLVPEYTESVLILRISLLGAIASHCCFFWNVTIVSNARQWMLVLLQCGVICAAFGMNLLFLELGLGVTGVALASLCSMLIYAWVQQWLAVSRVLGCGGRLSGLAWKGSLRFVGFVVSACGLALAGFGTLSYAVCIVVLASAFYGSVWVRGVALLREHR